MLSRRVSRYELSFLKTDHAVQYAVVLNHPKHVDAYIDKLLKTVNAFHVKYDGKAFHWVDGTPTVMKIPSSVRNAIDACNWSNRSLNQRSMYERAATLAVRDTMIVFATNHSLLDGVSMPALCHLRPIVAPKFPLAVDELFTDEMAKITKAQLDAYMERAAQFAVFPLSKTGTTDGLYCEHIVEKHSPEKFQCYDKNRRQIRGLTEALWAAMLLPPIAASGRFDKLGVGTCYSIRPLTGRKDVDVGNIWGPVPILCPRTNDPNMTIADLGKEMRKDFLSGEKRREWLLGLKTSWAEYDPRRFNGVVPIVSSAGVLKVEDPLVDFWGQPSMKTRRAGSVMLLAVSLALPSGMQVCTRFQYPPTLLSKEDGEWYFKMIMHVMMNIPPTTTLRDAVDELRRLRRK